MKAKTKDATLSLIFRDGTSRHIRIKRAIEINTTGKQSLSFHEAKEGEWVMSFTKSLTEGKGFADHFLQAFKHEELDQPAITEQRQG